MNQVKALLTALALGAPLVLGAGAASAQSHSFSSQQTQRMNRFMPAQLVRKTGVVQTFLYSGRQLRGVVLTDGTTVLLRRTDRSLFRTVRPGALVRFRGFVRPTGDRRVVRNATIAAVRRDLRNRSYTRAYVRPSPDVERAPIAAHGTITSIVRSADGRPRLVVLSNGLTVTVPVSLMGRFGPHSLRVGERVSMTSHMMGANPGSPLVVHAITFSDGTTIRTEPQR